jgi:hypothetical protein
MGFLHGFCTVGPFLSKFTFVAACGKSRSDLESREQ